MTQRKDNYKIQVMQAKQRFLGYDQQELIRRCRLRYDEDYFYLTLLSEPYRLDRHSGDMQRLCEGQWVDGDSFNEVMTVLDWLCDSRADRYPSGRWINVVTHGHYFHRQLQEDGYGELAAMVDRDPDAFEAACRARKGEAMSGADMGFALELIDGLRVYVQFWHGDEEFKPRLRCLWDEHTERYLRYETTWYATGLLMQRIRERMEKG